MLGEFGASLHHHGRSETVFGVNRLLQHTPCDNTPAGSRSEAPTCSTSPSLPDPLLLEPSEVLDGGRGQCKAYKRTSVSRLDNPGSGE